MVAIGLKKVIDDDERNHPGKSFMFEYGIGGPQVYSEESFVSMLSSKGLIFRNSFVINMCKIIPKNVRMQIMKTCGTFLEWLPWHRYKQLLPDDLIQMEQDFVLPSTSGDSGMFSLKSLGIEPTPVGELVEDILLVHRSHFALDLELSHTIAMKKEVERRNRLIQSAE